MTTKADKLPKKPRVTTLIDTGLGWNKQSLIGWAKNKSSQVDTIKESACEIGSYVHKIIESHIFGAEIDSSKASMDAIVAGNQALECVNTWEKMFKPEYIESEYPIETEEFTGTLDGLLKMNSEYDFVLNKWVFSDCPIIHLFDIKTSNKSKTSPSGVYLENIVQLGAYWKGLQENILSAERHIPTGFLIIHCDKEIQIDDGVTKETPVQFIPIAPSRVMAGKLIFEKILEIYKLKSKLEG